MRNVGGAGFFYYPERVFARVTQPHPVDRARLDGSSTDADKSPTYADTIPLTHHTYHPKMPFMHPFGILRLPRRGQIVAVDYMQGYAQFPIGSMHVFNADTDLVDTNDPMPMDPSGVPLVDNLDDFAIYHDETSSFIRFRNAASTSGKAAKDGGPGDFSVNMRSGAQLRFLEYQQDGYPPPTPTDNAGQAPPPPPTQARFTITMPGGTIISTDDVTQITSIVTGGGNSMTINDPEQTIVLKTAGGHTITLDDKGHSPVGITLQSAQGLKSMLDDTEAKIVHQATDTVFHEVNKATGEITTFAKSVGIGDYPANLSSDAAAMLKSHVTTFEQSMQTQRLQDLIKLTSALIGAGGLLNPSACASAVAALIMPHIPVPQGSEVLKVLDQASAQRRRI